MTIQSLSVVYIVPWFLLLALPLPTQYMWFVSCIWYLMQSRFDKVNFVLRYQHSRTASNCHWRTYDGSRKSCPWGRSFGVCSWVQSPSECCAVCVDIMLNVTTIYLEFIIYGANTNFLCSEYYLLSSVTHLMRHVRKHWYDGFNHAIYRTMYHPMIRGQCNFYPIIFYNIFLEGRFQRV